MQTCLFLFLSKCIEMDKNESKGPKLIEMDWSGPNRLQWIEVDWSGLSRPKWTELTIMVCNGPNELTMDRNRPKWPEMVQSGCHVK